jgi:4-amino-4-deoxy-L-arabinose transferase-like glycosyltransferase
MKAFHGKAIILGVLAFVLLSANIGGYSIYILDEARNSQCAREMWQSGDWIVPTFNQQLRTDKPPLHYYFMGIAYAQMGVSPYSARFFSAILGSVLISLLYLFGRRYLNEEKAIMTILALLASFGFVVQFHLAVPDPYLIFFMTLSLLFYYQFHVRRRLLLLIIAYTCVGLAVLAKGPVAILLPGLIVLVHLIIERQLTMKSILALRPIVGIMLVLLVAGPWYVLVHIKSDGAWTEGFWLDHNISRFNNPKEGHGGFFLLPMLYFFSLILPFGVFLFQAIVKYWKSEPLVRFCTVIILVVVIFFSFASTKLPSYVSPALPFAALVLGNYLTDTRNSPGLKIGFWSFMIIALGIWVAVFLLVPNVEGIEFLGHLHWYFLVIPVASIAALGLYYLKKTKLALFAMMAGFIVAHQIFFYFVFPSVDRENPVRQTAHIVLNAPHVVYYKRMNQAYPFLLNKKIPAMRSAESIHEEILKEPGTVIITRPKYLVDLEELQLVELTRKPDLFDNTTTVLLRGPDN